MQKSPAPIFWLLLAATISVDAVAGYELSQSHVSDSLAMLCLGLAFGELSVVCIWIIFARPTSRLRWLLAYFGATLAAFVLGPQFYGPTYVDWLKAVVGFALFFWLHVSLVLGCLWILKQYRFSYAYRVDDSGARWQVSMLQLLILTTVMALTLGLYAKTRIFQGEQFVIVGLWTVTNAILAAGGVLTRSFKFRVPFRLATLAAIAIGSCAVLGILFNMFDRMRSDDLVKLIASQLIQAIVLFIWMECVPFVPTPDRDVIPTIPQPTRSDI